MICAVPINQNAAIRYLLLISVCIFACVMSSEYTHFSSRNFKGHKFHVGKGKCLRMSCEREMSVWSMEMSASLNTHA